MKFYYFLLLFIFILDFLFYITFIEIFRISHLLLLLFSIITILY